MVTKTGGARKEKTSFQSKGRGAARGFHGESTGPGPLEKYHGNSPGKNACLIVKGTMMCLIVPL